VALLADGAPGVARYGAFSCSSMADPNLNVTGS